MSDHNIELIHKFWEGFNAHDLGGWDELCSANFLNHDPGFPEPAADLQTTKQFVGALLAAFPDMTSSEEDMVVGTDKISTRRTLRGTHQGEFMGFPPSGKQVEVGGIWLSHFAEGKLTEQWVHFDAAGIMRQIGMIPGPGEG